jgi:hypothetical protein
MVKYGKVNSAGNKLYSVAARAILQPVCHMYANFLSLKCFICIYEVPFYSVDIRRFLLHCNATDYRRGLGS